MSALAGLRKWYSTIAILIVWQLGSSSHLIPNQILSGPDQVLRSFLQLLSSGELLKDVAISLLRALTGLLLALVIGVSLSLAASLFQRGEEIIDLPVQMARALPFLGLAPLFILWFGIGEISKIALVTLGAFFPIYINLYAGVRSTDKKLIEACTLLGLSRWERILHVVLPTAMPSFLVGLRYALSAAWLSLVVAEQINADSGIGYLVMQARDYLRTDTMVVGLAVYAFLGWLSHTMVRQLETRLLNWRPAMAR
jgi:sulfonate transport system permease protein